MTQPATVNQTKDQNTTQAGTVYGYCRCSTDETKQDTERQARELRAAGATMVFTEYAHGTAPTKTEQQRLFSAVKPGDTIVVTEVSRLTRSTRQLCELIEDLKAKQLRLVILNSVTIDCRTGEPDPMTMAFVQMAGVFAELERSMIRERVKSGLANAQAKGTRSGRPIGRPAATEEDIPAKFMKALPLYQAGTINKSQLANISELSRPSVYKYLTILGLD